MVPRKFIISNEIIIEKKMELNEMCCGEMIHQFDSYYRIPIKIYYYKEMGGETNYEIRN